MWKQSYYLVLGVVIFCFFFLISCGGGGGGSAPQSPRIFVPTQIDFGDIIIDDIADQAFTIRNVGSSTLTIGQIAQKDPLATPFNILNDACSGNTLTANQKCTLTVQFAPTSQERFTGHFDIPSDDPHFPSVTVEVIGNAEGLRVSINQTTTNICDNVELQIAVFDKDGFPISGLTLDNVKLYENDELMKIVLTSLGSSILPVSVAMVLDFSDTMTPFIDDVIFSSKQFVDQLNSEDKAAIIKFAKTYELKQDFTDNTIDLKTAINDPYIGDIVATLMYDTIWYAIDLTAEQQNNRSIVVISDGKDENPSNPYGVGSVKTLNEVINHAKEKGVSIFTIGLGDPISVDVMSQLANETGGQYFAAPNSDKLAGIYQEIRDILNGHYKITYTSTASDPIMAKVVVTSGIYQGDAVKQIQGCP